jgi:hypothetical protein
VTEAEWLACAEPQTMVSFLKRRATRRKLRLFSVACCRRIWPLIAKEESRAAVLIAERFADGQATKEELLAAYGKARAAWFKDLEDTPAWACFLACTPEVAGLHAVGKAANVLAMEKVSQTRPAGTSVPEGLVFWRAIMAEEEAVQCQTFRDIFGNPFRPLPPRKGKRPWEQRKQDWLNANDGTARSLAEAIYEERGFDRMPILRDALEDAGCAEAAILDHCRNTPEHVRGCWVVDLLLDKK